MDISKILHGLELDLVDVCRYVDYTNISEEKKEDEEKEVEEKEEK